MGKTDIVFISMWVDRGLICGEVPVPGPHIIDVSIAAFIMWGQAVEKIVISQGSTGYKKPRTRADRKLKKIAPHLIITFERDDRKILKVVAVHRLGLVHPVTIFS
jgi:hypothetical protein